MSNLRKFPIAGIATSSDDGEALIELLRGVGRMQEMAFVAILPVPTEVAEEITRETRLNVSVSEDGTMVVPGHLYLAPPDTALRILNGRLRHDQLSQMMRPARPVDQFFASLAADQGEFAVGILLSGENADGTLGVKTIKEAGGLAIAQAPDDTSVRNADMPASAIESHLVDIVLPAAGMGQKLAEMIRSFGLLDGLVAAQEDADAQTARQAQRDIAAVLKERSGHDFSGYKPSTFFRRVRRRMQVVQVEALSDYIATLSTDPDEVVALFRDLLINVTNFFRDEDAFAHLENHVIPRLFDGKGPRDSVRIWVPGCATGEEVYSIAILMREFMDTLSEPPRVQIFATDIDEPALAVARTARYPEALLSSLSPERRAQFFLGEGNSFVLKKELREMCIFSPHSVIRDPPFSRMDMVSCRNLLIYFGSEIQGQVIPTFHYSLRPGGYLFLGTSENISQYGDLFTTVDKKHRIFQSRETRRALPRLPMALDFVRLPEDGFTAPLSSAVQFAQSLRQAVDGQVLDRHAPAHVATTADGDVVYYSGRTGRFLEAPQGVPSRHLLTMARQGLRLDLRGALREAIETRRPAIRRDLLVEDEEGRTDSVDIVVEPLANRVGDETLFLVIFDSRPASRSAAHRPALFDGAEDMERELRDTRERLQSTIEEYETALEELKASNEELVSVNEEAQSTNEELEASKEEMQSLNEELNTINAELIGKVEELGRANSDLRNLFETSPMATVFLDRSLVIRNFTPAASTFFNLRPSDVGRPLTDLSSHLEYPELKDHIQQVFSQNTPLEHQLKRDASGAHHLVRLMPYREKDERADGVVVTFVDVTTLAEAEERQRILVAELNHRVKNMLAIVGSIAKQTFRHTPEPERFIESLLGRLSAMSQAYAMVGKQNWQSVPLRDLLRQELSPFGPERAVLTGDDVDLSAEQCLSFSLILHELATNAAKYGALSRDGGKVDISWTATNRRIAFHWREIGGPPVTTPAKNGFGLKLVGGEITYRLNGTIDTRFPPEGLDLSFEVPLT